MPLEDAVGAALVFRLEDAAVVLAGAELLAEVDVLTETELLGEALLDGASEELDSETGAEELDGVEVPAPAHSA